MVTELYTEATEIYERRGWHRLSSILIEKTYQKPNHIPKTAQNVINSGIIYNIKLLQLTLLPLDGKEEGSR